MPRSIRWIFLAFIAYVLYAGNFAHQSTAVIAPISPLTAEESAEAAVKADHYHTLSNFTDSSRWQRAINPKYIGEVNASDIVKGQGTAAACGSEVTIRLRGTLSDGSTFDEAHDESKPLTFVVGKAPYKALNEGIIGMQTGGARQLTASPYEVYEGTPPNMDSVLFRLELVKTSPESSQASLPIAAMQVHSPLVKDEMPQARCGESATFHLQWFDASGSQTKEETRTITLGERQLGVGFDRVAQGMVVDEVRLALLPPAWQTASKHTQTVLITRVAPKP